MFTNPPCEIKVNSIPIKIGQPTQFVYSLEINVFYQQINIPKNQKLQITTWLNDLVKKCKANYILYQGVLIPKKDVKLYGEKK